METSTLGSLRVRRVVKVGQPGATKGNNEDKAPLTVVLLHGFGAPGDDLVGLAAGLDAPPGTVFVFPEALLPLRLAETQPQALFGDTRAWWMIDFARVERAIELGELRDLSGEVPEGLGDARAAVTEMLDALAREPSQTGRRLVLGGFSQGAMLSLDVALRDSARKLAGVALLSGTMIAEREWTPLMKTRSETPIFQSHGERDPILPFSIAERLRDALKSAGLDVTFDPFDGPHTITPRTLQRLSGWLRTLA